MLPLTGFTADIPSEFQGTWKLKIDMTFQDAETNKEVNECLEVNFEIMEA
jgi:hypothetical protein